jgi:H+-transporting ATPase
MAAITVDVLVGTLLTSVGLPDLMLLPGWQTLAIFVYSMVSCVVVNDAFKVALIRWRILAVAE